MAEASMKAQYKVGVIGGGSWGTALAIAANRAGSDVTLTTRNKNVVDVIRETRMNDIYLPNVFIDPSIEITNDLSEVCRTDVVIVAVPSHCMRSACIAISDLIPPTTPLVLGSKGVERGSLLFMSEVVASVLPGNPVAILSGPNFAGEVASSKPTATTIACTDVDLGEVLQYCIGSKYFRPYLSTDVIGVQIGGSIKNVIAIACGIAMGLGMGENARAAIITRGFAEMTRFAMAMGAQLETLTGLSGFGDLLLTCTSATSRNTSLGMALGRGDTNEEMYLGEGRGVVEGAVAAESVVKLAKKHKVDMPICEAVHRVLAGEINMEKAIETLLDRPFAMEWQK